MNTLRLKPRLFNFLTLTLSVLLASIATGTAIGANLYGVTGDGGGGIIGAPVGLKAPIAPTTLFTLNQTTGAATFFQTLGNGDSGEAIAFNPSNGLMYHWSGFSTQVMESINLTTNVVTNIPMTGAHGEILAGTWDAVNSRFIVTDGSNRMFGVTTSGAFTLLNASVGPYFKGLAFVGTTLYGVNRDTPAGISTINPTTGVVLTTTAVTAPALTETLVGFNGLATNPATGVLWAILRTNTNVRRVGTITPAGVFTSVAVIADNFAGIAFDAAVLPPTISKAFGTAQITVGQTTSLTFTLGNPNTFSLTGVGFTDTFPAGIVTAVPVTTTNSCSGGHAGNAGSTSLTGGTIAAGGTCVVTVNVTGTTVGVKNNTTSTVSAINGGIGGTASASITVVAVPLVPPSIAKIFGAAVFPINTNTNLNFLASNGNAFPITVSFTDTLPAGLVVANLSGTGNNCGGTVSAVPLSNLITFTGTVPANSSCQVALLVTGTTPGVKDNTSSAISSLEAGTGNVATASTIVALPPVILKLFSVAVLPLNGVTTLLFNIRNTNPSNVLTGVAFTDNLPAGLKVATPSVITNSCSGTVTAVAGSGTISLTGGGPLAPA